MPQEMPRELAAGGTGPPLTVLLRTSRRSAGLTQRDLARKTGLSVGAIRDLEQGRRLRPRPSSIGRLATALGLDSLALRELNPEGHDQPGRMTRHDDPAAHGRPGLWLQLLGPVTGWHGDTVLDLGPPRQRAVLAVLALEPDKPVNRSTIIDAVWGTRPPASAVNLIQTYVSRLRRALQPGRSARTSAGSGDLLSSAGGSYRLRVTAEQLDLLSFRKLAGDGQSSWPEAAARALSTALALWQGDPVADLAALRAYPPVVGLADEWRTAIIGYADACGQLGRPGDAIAQLRAAAARHPLDERLHGRLMTALASAGRQADALQVYGNLRHRLDTELGVGPGPELSATHLRVLRGEPRPERESTRAVPRQLPREIPTFVGRAEHLDRLTAALDHADTQGRPLPIWVITGPPGVGKSALALRWAHHVSDRFPDGQIHVDLQGFAPAGQSATLTQLIGCLLEMLQIPAERRPTSLEAQLALYRSLLADKRMLLIFDNAHDPERIRRLLPAGTGCLVLVTSRDRLLGLVATHAADLLALDVFSDAEAHELLARALPARSLAGEPAAAAQLIRLCGRLPLALAIVTARARSGARSLGALVDDLRGTPVRLDALDTGDATANVRAVFSWSYRGLSRAAASVFRLLGLHRGPDISTHAVASLADVTLPEATALLGELTRLHMVTEHAPGRFVLHDLLRAYAAEELRADHGDAGRRTAAQRVLDYYLHTAHTAALSINPARDALDLAPARAGAAPETISERGPAHEWFRAEYNVLLQAIWLAVENDLDDYAWQIPWALVNFFDRQGYWQDWITTHQAALSAAQRSGSLIGQASSHQNISIVYVHLGYHQDAQSHLQRAIALHRDLGTRVGQARCLLDIARAFEIQGRYRNACEHASSALEIYTELGHDFGQARALNAVGWNTAHLGDARYAVTCCERALQIHSRLRNRTGQAAALDSLGYAHTQLGEHADAIRCYEQALDLLGRGERTYQHACVLSELATTHQAARSEVAAAEAARQALVILSALKHPDADRTRARLAAAGIPVPGPGRDARPGEAAGTPRRPGG